MKRKTLLMLGGVLLSLVAIAAIVIVSYVQSLTAPVPLEISYATVQTALPQNAACAAGSQDGGGVAKEILNLETDFIYVAGGDNPIPDDVWSEFSFRLPLLKNSTRNLLFSESCFFRSPEVPVDCSGDGCFTIEEIVGYTWLNLTQVVGQSCFPDASGCSGDVVNPGYISVNTIAKCHRMVYDGPLVYELSDGQGNLYVMHATDDGVPDLDPALPVGWSLTARTIDEPLELLPFGGGADCYYNIVRDNLVQSYHQYAYADAFYPPQG